MRKLRKTTSQIEAAGCERAGKSCDSPRSPANSHEGKSYPVIEFQRWPGNCSYRGMSKLDFLLIPALALGMAATPGFGQTPPSAPLPGSPGPTNPNNPLPAPGNPNNTPGPTQRPGRNNPDTPTPPVAKPPQYPNTPQPGQPPVPNTPAGPAVPGTPNTPGGTAAPGAVPEVPGPQAQ
ncbi:MAG: hypothetical protein JWN34_5728 [Bryobacterales bacterium]|nr:hypothetical protein [Bryobacterales bacterium]